jgi:DeoR/GlpR family transcriptional regulator of sugar metabolism
VARTHGGVVAREAAREEAGDPDLLANRQLRKDADARRRIALEAARRVNDGGVVLLDAGATARALAGALAGREVTVVTMDLKVAEAAATGRTLVHLVGGLVRNDHFSLSGSWARQMLADMRADVFFFSPQGLAGPDFGARTCEDAELKRAAMERSGRTIALAEANTFTAGVFAPVCPAGAVSEIISDRALKALPDALNGSVRRLTLV